MAAKVMGISLNPKLLKDADRLAKRRKMSRSALVASLLERELAREQNEGVRDVRVDGVLYVPARNGAR